MKIWDAAELDSFLEGAKDTPYYAPLHLLAFTGMRRSEVCGLQWADLDLVGGNVHVSRTLSAEGGKVSFRDTKTAASRRTVSLPPSAAVVLRTHRANCEAMAAGFRRTIDARELVFASADGRPLLPDTLTHVFEQLVKNTGVTPVRLHDLRHLHASLLLSSGVHPKVVQSRLGHASITTTLNVYSHVTPGLEEAAAKRFDEAVKVVSGRTQVGAR